MVLLVDGDNLLTIGFHGMKNYFYKGKHIGGIYYVINTLRRMFDSHQLEKIVVFWDGENSSSQRELIYHSYKKNRKKKEKTEEEKNSFQYQKERVQLYLEEIFVRQGEFDNCESDDCIAQYIKDSDEDIIVVSSDGDMTQLVSDRVRLYNPIHQKMYQKGDKYNYKRFEFPIENVILLKMLCGDESDNIVGLKNIGIKRILNFFPEILEEEKTLESVLNKSRILYEENNNWVLKHIVTGISNGDLIGDKFYEINKRLIKLDEPFLTQEAKETIQMLITDTIDSEGRSYKNAMKLMMEDGIHLVLPKVDTAWVNFLTPFLKLTRKEKNKQKRIFKIKNNE